MATYEELKQRVRRKGRDSSGAQQPAGRYEALKARVRAGDYARELDEGAADPAMRTGIVRPHATPVGPRKSQMAFADDWFGRGYDFLTGDKESAYEDYLARQDALKRLLAEYDTVSNNITNYASRYKDSGAYADAVGQILEGLKSQEAYYSAFGDENAYNENLARQAEYKRLSEYDTDSAKARLDALNAKLEELAAARRAAQQEYSGYSRGHFNRQAEETKARYEALARQQKALEAEIGGLERDYAAAQKVHKEDEYRAYQNAEDFEKYAAEGAALKNPSGLYVEGLLGGLFNKGVKNKVTHYLDHNVKTGKAYEYLSREERDLYNYLLAKEGEESADAYLDHMRETLNYRAGTGQAEGLEGNRPAQYIYGLGAGLDQWMSGTKQLLSQDPLPISATQFGSAAVREDLEGFGAKLPAWLGGASLGQAAYDAATTTANMAPSILLSSLTAGLGAPAGVAAGVGAAALGGSAGGNAYNQAVKEGYTKNEARNYAALIGASEAGLSYVLGGVSKLGGVLTGKTAQAAVKNIDNALFRIAADMGVKMFGEGAEEYLQDILEPAFRNLCFDERNEIKPFTPEAAYSFLLGALTAGLVEGVVDGSIRESINTERSGKNIIQAGKADELIANALALAPKAEAYKLAQELQAGKAHKNNANIGALLESYAKDGGDLSFINQPTPAANGGRTEQAAEAVEGQAGLERATGPEALEALEGAPPRGMDRKPAEAAQAPMHTVATAAKATLDSGAAVEVKGVAAVEDAGLFLRLADGKTAPVEAVAFDDPGMDKLYGLASKFDTKAARAFVSGYDGALEPGSYYNGFASIYGGARTGKTLEQAVSGSLYGRMLPPHIQQLAYFAGQNAGKLADTKLPAAEQAGRAAESPLRESANTGPAIAYQPDNGKPGGVRRLNSVKLSAAQENQVNALDVVFRTLGRTVELVDSIHQTGADGRVTKQSAANARFDPNTNTYTIAVDGLGEAYMYFAVHESIHDIKANNAVGYGNLENVVFAYLHEAGQDVDTLVAYQKELATAGMTAEQIKAAFPRDAELTAYAMEEVVANAVPAILTDPETGRAFAERFLAEDAETRTLFGKLLDSILDFMRQAYEILSGQKSWQQMRTLEQDIEAISDIRAAYFEALEGLKESGPITETESGAENGLDNGKARYSINPAFAQEYDAWDKASTRGYFVVGATSEALQSIGVNPKNIEWDKGKIVKIKEKHPGMTDAVIKQVPNILERPILIMQSKQADSRVVLFGEVFDANQVPVLAVLELQPKVKQKFDLDVIKIASAYGKDTNPQKLINESRILYVDPDKNRTDRWLEGTRLQLPFDLKNYGSINKIAYHHASVKDSIGQNGEKSAPKFSMKDVQRRAEEEIGTTSLWSETGYITPEGKQLDFSGKRDGGPAGHRNMDHREIALAFDADGGIDGTDAMIAFMAAGNIRISPENGGINLSALPTDAQRQKLQAFINRNHGEVTVDFDDKKGNTLHSVEYPGGMGAVRVTNDIKRYFVDGVKPEISEVQRFRFSLKDTPPVNTEALAEELPEGAVAKLKGQIFAAKAHNVTTQSLDAVAGKLLAEMKSGYDAAAFQAELREVFDFLAGVQARGPEDIDTAVVDAAAGLMRKALEASKAMDTELSAQYANARAYLKKTPIRLTEAQRGEAAYGMDSYRDFKNALSGYVRLVNKDGMSLDAAWKELSALQPGLFDPEAAEGDMPARLYEAVQAMKPRYVNPYGFDLDRAAFDFTLRMFDLYYGLPEVRRLRNEVQAAAQARYADRLKRYKAEETAKRRELSRKYNEAKALQHKEDMARYRAQYRRLASLYQEKLLEQRAAQREWRATDRAKRQQSEEARKYRGRIEANAKALYRWLTHPTDAKHVPEALRKTVGDFLLTIDFAGDKDTKRAAAWREKMYALKDALQKAEGNQADYGDFYADIDPDFIPRLEAFIGGNRETVTVAGLDVEQLRELDFLVGIVKRSVTEANKLHANARYAVVAQLGEASRWEMDGKKAATPRGKLAEMADRLLNVEQLDSFSYFDQLGGAAKTILEGLRGGLDKKVRNVETAMDYTREALKGIDLRKLSGKGAKLHTFKVKGGELRLTTAQVMELYLLNKREQARGHIYGGGIKPLDTAVRQGNKTHRLRSYRPLQVTEADVAHILAALTPEQKQAADAMQRFLGKEAAAWGNEVSMRMYGYKKFTEENYYPIRSDENYTKTQDPSPGGGLYALRNLGLTKATVKGANNPLLLGDIFDTFTRHVDDMATYNAFVVPLSDAMKWFNYQNRETGGSVKQSIERILGKAGKDYFTNLIRDINGVNTGSYGSGLADSLLRNAKVAAVGANARVVLQQPTAYVRAAAMIDPKYLAKAVFKKSNAAKARQYSAIAQWKAWGFFDLNLGRSLRELIVGDQTTSQKVREGMLWLAGKADDITWGALWNACELEMRDKQPGLAPGSEAFNVAVGKRLSEVIDRTQVVDSVFHRSQLMRSKDRLTQLYTSFMSEPTKSYNMLRNAVMEYAQNRDKASAGKLTRVALSYVATAVATAAAAAVADAFRDEDDEKEWLEKYADAMGANLLDNVNPLNLIPGGKDIVSLLQGYDASRLDLQGLSKLLNVAQAWEKHFGGTGKWSLYKLIYKSVDAVSSLTGIPAGNLMRTLNSLYNAVSETGIDWESETSTTGRTYEALYAALRDGDTEKAARLKNKLAEGGRTPADIDRGVRDVLEVADPRIAQIARFQQDGNQTDRLRLIREVVADGFKQDIVVGAVNNYITRARKQGLEPAGDKPYTESLYTYADLETELLQGYSAELEDVLAYLKQAGKTDAALRSRITQAMKPTYIQLVRDGDTAAAGRLKAALLRLDLGKNSYDAKDIEGWVK